MQGLDFFSLVGGFFLAFCYKYLKKISAVLLALPW